MPSSTEKRFIKLATRLIKKRGRDIQLITKVASGEKFDPDFADQSVTIKAAQISFKSTEVDGAIIRIEDKRFLIDSAVEPKNKMRIIDGSTNYSVQNVEIVGPGGAHILYKVQARI